MRGARVQKQLLDNSIVLVKFPYVDHHTVVVEEDTLILDKPTLTYTGVKGAQCLQLSNGSEKLHIYGWGEKDKANRAKCKQ